MYTLPNVLNKLNDINNVKGNIKNALINKGENMTGVNFENYPVKVDNLNSGLVYARFNNMNRTNFNQELNVLNIRLFNTMSNMFLGCYNLQDIPNLNTSNISNMSGMVSYCNNLSNQSIQNIINMCLISNISGTTNMNLNVSCKYSPFYNTKFDNSYYTNRFTELTTAGWTY